jgi:hypothetical protein
VCLISISKLKIKMKKITVLVLAIVLLVSSVAIYRPARAETHEIKAKSGGLNCGDGGSFDPSIITINAGDSITFKVPSDDPYPAGLEIHGFPGGNFTILPGGSHITPALLVDVPNYYATWPSTTCKKGTGNIIVKQPETPVAVPTAPPPPPPPVVPTALPPPPPNMPPEVLKLDQAKIDDTKIDVTKPISIDRSKPLTISGYTIANGVINLTIHSTVRTELARANSEGFWSFTIENLEPGSHTVEASVTDLATRLTSENTTILKFAVTGDASSSVAAHNTFSVPNASKKGSNIIVPAIIIALVILAAVAAAGFWKLKKHKNNKQDSNTAAPPPVQIQPSL